jgi:hypothetical protein
MSELQEIYSSIYKQVRPCYATNRIYSPYPYVYKKKQPNICVDGGLDMKNKRFMSLYLKHYSDN